MGNEIKQAYVKGNLPAVLEDVLNEMLEEGIIDVIDMERSIGEEQDDKPIKGIQL